MRSTVNLIVEISHSQNLPTDAQGIADVVSRLLTEELASDPLASAFVKVNGAAVESKEERA